MEREITKHYNAGKITVVWKPHLCIHSGICFRGLPEVFDPRRKPWIITENSDAQTIREQILKCPSGALSFTENTEKK